MYGMVNRAIEDMIVSTSGCDSWNCIKQEAGVDLAEFLNSSMYSDELTFKLVSAASKHLETTPEKILHAFGRYWILYTGKEGWASVIELGGDTMVSFLEGLDSMHARVQVALPDAQMPQFSVTDHDDFLELVYRSPRDGLAPMVLGLLDGLAEKFDEHWSIKQVKYRATHSADVFHLRLVAQSAGIESKNVA